MKDELSQTMQAALKLANDKGNGKLTRFPGGVWRAVFGERVTATSFGTTTVEALVARGKMKYTKWQRGGRLRAPFPIEATTTVC